MKLKYLFLRPTIQEIVDRYNAKFRLTKTTAAEAEVHNRLVFGAAPGSHFSILFHLGTARGLYCPLKYSRRAVLRWAVYCMVCQRPTLST